MNLKHLLLALFCPAIFNISAAEAVRTIATADGLSLTFGDRGRITALRLDERPVALSSNAAFLQVRDAAAQSRFVPVDLSVAGSAGELRFKSEKAVLDLNVSARLVQHGNYLQLDGEATDRTGRDRCIDLRVSLPLERERFALGTGLAEGVRAVKKNARKQKATDLEIDESVPEDNALYPLCPMSDAAGGAGLSLAVPPTHPTRFSIGKDASGAFILLRLGLSPAAATPGRTAFRVILYRHDPGWGFRASLARYYDFYRADFFTRHVKKIGAWTSQNASKLKHPELYAYHEAGFPTWRHPSGTDSGVNVKLTLEHLDEGSICNSLAEYEQLCELALDEKYGIYSLPYTIVGQRQLLQLPALPQNLDEALKTVETWSPAQPILFDGPPQAVSFRSADELKAIIRWSTIHDAQHRPQYVARPYRGPTLTFPQNPNPALYRDGAQPTIAKYTLDYYLPMMFKSRFVDGCYLDSLGRWCGFYNYRAEHFKDATLPLTYSGSPPQPCIWSLQSHAEYLWKLGERLHAQDKIFIANGVHPNRVMLGFACDVMGGEGAPSYTAGEDFYSLRVAAGIKPYCLLNASHHVSPKLWNSCLYLGYLMGCNAEKGLADEVKYLPLVIRLNEASWQPITYARATPSAVGIERWGGQNANAPLFFTVMNRSTEAVHAEIIIDLAALHRSPQSHATTLPTNLPLTSDHQQAQWHLRLNLDPEQATAIRIDPP